VDVGKDLGGCLLSGFGNTAESVRRRGEKDMIPQPPQMNLSPHSLLLFSSHFLLN